MIYVFEVADLIWIFFGTNHFKSYHFSCNKKI